MIWGRRKNDVEGFTLECSFHLPQCLLPGGQACKIGQDFLLCEFLKGNKVDVASVPCPDSKSEFENVTIFSLIYGSSLTLSKAVWLSGTIKDHSITHKWFNRKLKPTLPYCILPWLHLNDPQRDHVSMAQGAGELRACQFPFCDWTVHNLDTKYCARGKGVVFSPLNQSQYRLSYSLKTRCVCSAHIALLNGSTLLEGQIRSLKPEDLLLIILMAFQSWYVLHEETCTHLRAATLNLYESLANQ